MNQEQETEVIRRCYICGAKFVLGVAGLSVNPGEGDRWVDLCDGCAGVERDSEGYIANRESLWATWDAEEAAQALFEPEDGGARLFQGRALDVAVHEARTGRPVHIAEDLVGVCGPLPVGAPQFEVGEAYCWEDDGPHTIPYYHLSVVWRQWLLSEIYGEERFVFLNALLEIQEAPVTVYGDSSVFAHPDGSVWGALWALVAASPETIARAYLTMKARMPARAKERA